MLAALGVCGIAHGPLPPRHRKAPTDAVARPGGRPHRRDGTFPARTYGPERGLRAPIWLPISSSGSWGSWVRGKGSSDTMSQAAADRYAWTEPDVEDLGGGVYRIPLPL